MKVMTTCLLLLSCSAPLTGCAHWMVKSTKVDPALLRCEGPCAVPAAPVTNRQNAAYVACLRFAWADCHGKLAAVETAQSGF